ncbi:MAG: hypothetical protein KA314_20020 [Chloroflexi bacterium]|nr:hypothetical protein [Chloroflexota bacterium]MBP8058124.1 hypothetical protein [Chloroflexota bacterium]
MEPVTLELNYIEETFGILTDDDVYLDCLLLRPKNTSDTQLKALHIWVPRHPLTKATLITCARQEINALGNNATTAHLLFDLRGTGESEGGQRDRNFDMDLAGIKAWAQERFGDIRLGFLGIPDSKNGRVRLTPIRPGVVMENYFFPARLIEGETTHQPVIYLSTFSSFTPIDDALCAALSRAGYDVYGLDPLRYLLHASSRERLTPNILWGDWRAFCRMIGESLLMVAQPISAGLALLLAANIDQIKGVVAIGRAQMAFKPWHIFSQENPYSFMLARHVSNLSPRPVLFILNERQKRQEEIDELNTLYQTAMEPRKLVRVPQVDPNVLIRSVAWLENPQ